MNNTLTTYAKRTARILVLSLSLGASFNVCAMEDTNTTEESKKLLSEAAQAIENLEHQLEDLRIKIQNQELEKTTLIQEKQELLEKTRNDEDVTQQQAQQLITSGQRIEELTHQIENKNQEIQQLVQQIENKDQRIQQLAQQIENNNQEIQEKNIENSELLKNNEEMGEEALNTIKQLNTQLEEIVTTAQQRETQLQQENRRITEEINRITEENNRQREVINPINNIHIVVNPVNNAPVVNTIWRSRKIALVGSLLTLGLTRSPLLTAISPLVIRHGMPVVENFLHNRLVSRIPAPLINLANRSMDIAGSIENGVQDFVTGPGKNFVTTLYNGIKNWLIKRRK